MARYRDQPFGYQIVNGAIQVEPTEAEVVRGVFHQYIEKKLSFAEIAQDLTARNIPYSKVRDAWDKHLVKRLLENQRYVGGNAYPAILVDKELLDQVSEISRARYTQLPSAPPSNIRAIRGKAFCTHCGKALVRACGNGNSMGSWTCRNKECPTTFLLSDRELLDAIAILLQSVQEYPEPLKSPLLAEQNERKLQGMELQINEELGNGAMDDTYLKDLIRSSIQARYDACPAAMELQRRHALAQNIRLRTLTPTFDPDLFEALVHRVEIDSTGVALLLHNGDRLEPTGDKAKSEEEMQ